MIEREPTGSTTDGTSMVGAAQTVLQRVRMLRASSTATIVVGIDGRSGAGKTTLAAAITALASTPVTVIEGDLFYAGGRDETWDRRSAMEKVDWVIDWRRQRPVLEALRAGEPVRWHRFDWDAEDWDDPVAPFDGEPMCSEPAPIVVLEGAYSCRPELHDLLDLRVLLAAADGVRRRQLLERDGATYRADWEARWVEAEEHYFGSVMPPSRFDLVIEPSHR